MLHWICIYLVEMVMAVGGEEVGIGDVEALAKEEGAGDGGRPKNENGSRVESGFIQKHEILLHQSNVGVIESLRGSLPKGNEDAKKELLSWMLGNEGLISPENYSQMLSEDNPMNLEVEGGTIDPQWDLENADDLSSNQVDLLLKYLVRKEKAYLHAGKVITRGFGDGFEVTGKRVVLEYDDDRELRREEEFVEEVRMANAVGGTLPGLDGVRSDEELFENRMDDFKTILKHRGYKANGKGEILWEEYGGDAGEVSENTENNRGGSEKVLEITYKGLNAREIQFAGVLRIEPKDGKITRKMYEEAIGGTFGGDGEGSDEKPEGGKMEEDDAGSAAVAQEADEETEVDGGETVQEKDEPVGEPSNHMLAAFQKTQGGDQPKKKINPDDVRVEPVTPANFEETANAMRNGGRIVPEKSENDPEVSQKALLEITDNPEINRGKILDAWKEMRDVGKGAGVRIDKKSGVLVFTKKAKGETQDLMAIHFDDLKAALGEEGKKLSVLHDEKMGYYPRWESWQSVLMKIQVGDSSDLKVSEDGQNAIELRGLFTSILKDGEEIEVRDVRKSEIKKEEESTNSSETGEVREDFEDLWKRLGMETFRGGEKTVEGRMGAKLIIPEGADYGDMQIVLQAEGKTIKLKIEDFFNNLSGLLNDDGKKAISNLMIDDDGVIKPTENVLEWSKALIELKAYGESPSRVSVELLREEGGASVAEHFRDYRANVIEGVYGDEDRKDDDFSMEIHLWRKPATVNVVYEDDEGKKGRVYMPVADFFKQIGADVKGLSAKEASDWKKLLKNTFGKDRSGMKIDIQNEDPNRKKK